MVNRVLTVLGLVAKNIPDADIQPIEGDDVSLSLSLSLSRERASERASERAHVLIAPRQTQGELNVMKHSELSCCRVDNPTIHLRRAFCKLSQAKGFKRKKERDCCAHTKSGAAKPRAR